MSRLGVSVDILQQAGAGLGVSIINSVTIGISQQQVADIPEPASLTLFGLAGLGLAAYRRRKA